MLTENEIKLSDQAKSIINNTEKKILENVYVSLAKIDDWNSKVIENTLKEIANNENLKLFNIASPIRAAVTGLTHSPSIFKVLELLGKENSIKRIKKSF